MVRLWFFALFFFARGTDWVGAGASATGWAGGGCGQHNTNHTKINPKKHKTNHHTKINPNLPNHCPAPPCWEKTGESNCKGYSDHPDAPQYQDRFKVVLVDEHPTWYSFGTYFAPVGCLDDQGRPELEPYLQCPPRAQLKQAALACQDKEVLDEPPEVMEARLSAKFCAEPATLVGRAFVEQVLASLDANKDGGVSCAEWGIASRTPTLEQLGGA
jgi:hypothetical protein